MHADNRGVDHLHGCIMRSSKRPNNLAPDPSLSPTDEAVVAGGVRTKAVGQIAPRGSGPQNPKDAVEDTPVIHAGHAARLVRKHRFDGRPLVVSEFVAHDSRLPFGGLNHELAADPSVQARSAECRLSEAKPKSYAPTEAFRF